MLAFLPLLLAAQLHGNLMTIDLMVQIRKLWVHEAASRPIIDVLKCLKLYPIKLALQRDVQLRKVREAGL